MVFVLILVLTISGIALSDSHEFLVDEDECIEMELKLLFDHSMERALIYGSEVKKIEGDINLVDIYFLGIIKYAEAEVSCNKGARVIWRR